MARPRTDIRERIVTAARARFLAEGVDGASLRTIARDARTSIGMVSYYFPTKDELFLAVVDAVYPRIVGDVAAALGGDAPVGERLRAAFARFGRASDDELDVVRLVVRELLVSASAPRMKQVFARFRRGHIGLLLAALADGVRDGDVDPELPVGAALAMTVAIGGVPQLLRRIARDVPAFATLPGADALADLSVERLLVALAPRPSRARRKRRSRQPP